MKHYCTTVPGSSLAGWLNLARSSFYYRRSCGKRGVLPSLTTLRNGQPVSNESVVEEIKGILQGPYTAYGYHQTAIGLKELGYRINHKKVYRLMKEHALLLGSKIKTRGKRQFVKFRRIHTRRPMEHICLDIKYVWVQGDGRWYYLLSILDVYSRFILIWTFQPNLRQHDVIRLMRKLHLMHNLKSVTIRNDNGSQFIAHKVREYLRQLEANQEFTHVSTPEENSYIESFHSILQRELIDRYEFESYYEAKIHLGKYMWWYNYLRRHGSIGNITPSRKWAQGMTGATVKQLKEADELLLSRPANTAGLDVNHLPPGLSLDRGSSAAYLHLTGEQVNQQHYTELNQKIVRRIGV